MIDEKRESSVRLLTTEELARELDCKGQRVRYLQRIGKLGYQSLIRRDGKRIYVFDHHRPAISLQKHMDLSELEKEVSYIILSAKRLQKKLIGLSGKFAQEEKALLQSRLKV